MKHNPSPHPPYKNHFRFARRNIIGMVPKLARLPCISMIRSTCCYTRGQLSLPWMAGNERNEHGWTQDSLILQLVSIFLQYQLTKLKEMFKIDVPHWARRNLCCGIVRRLLCSTMFYFYNKCSGKTQPDDDDGTGQFRMQARETFEAQEFNCWLLAHLESPRIPAWYEKRRGEEWFHLRRRVAGSGWTSLVQAAQRVSWK